MASLSALVRRGVLFSSRRAFSRSTTRLGSDYPWGTDTIVTRQGKEDVDVAPITAMTSGIERWEAIQSLRGIEDPYFEDALMIDPENTEVNPTEIPSLEPERTMGCLCDPEAFTYIWWELTAGAPQRCKCGYWFKLVPTQQYVEKMAKMQGEKVKALPSESSQAVSA